MEKNKTQDLQPWFDWFNMLRVYSEKGYLELQPAKGEAYITEPALFTLGNVQLPSNEPAIHSTGIKLSDTVARIKAYADYLTTITHGQTHNIFALHIVEPDLPHDLRYTIIVKPHRRWWWPWHKITSYKFIFY